MNKKNTNFSLEVMVRNEEVILLNETWVRNRKMKQEVAMKCGNK